MHPGGKWRGEFYTMALADVEKAKDFSRHGAHVQRVREILLLDGLVQFPLKLAFEKAIVRNANLALANVMADAI